MYKSVTKWSVDYNCNIAYDIIKTDNIFQPLNDVLLSVGRKENSHRFIVVDHAIHKLYATQIQNYFKKNKVSIKIVPFKSGEKNKSIDSYISLLLKLNSFPIDRRSEPIIAIGGGVLTDVVGFVASSYRRGIPRINVPTTLMGYVDAAIGIKTGINFDNNKNRIGFFSPPQKVILDRAFFKTLPMRHVLNGVCEIVKLAVIKDIVLFEQLETHGLACIESNFQNNISEILLERSITGMIEELLPNLFENNLERAVDFGHTLSPAFEQQDNLEILHGEAVIIDVAISTILAHIHNNILSISELERILNLIIKLKLLVKYAKKIDPVILWNSIIERTNHRDGLQRIPLPCCIGKCTFVNDIKPEELYLACDFFEKWIEKRNIEFT